jgi:hypothetical protein
LASASASRTGSLRFYRFRGPVRLCRHRNGCQFASRLCDEAKPGKILISPRVLTKIEDAVKVEQVGEFELKGIRRPLAAYNVLASKLPIEAI